MDMRTKGSTLKWAILGHAGHGKDTVAEMLQQLDPSLRFISSSRFAMKKVIWPVIGHRYSTEDECFDDRVNHRKEWYDLITAYNSLDRSRLASELMKDYDIYVGLRNREELLMCKKKGLFDIVLWVDRSKLVGEESIDSCTVRQSDCTHWIDNNGEKDVTLRALTRLLEQ